MTVKVSDGVPTEVVSIIEGTTAVSDRIGERSKSSCRRNPRLHAESDWAVAVISRSISYPTGNDGVGVYGGVSTDKC